MREERKKNLKAATKIKLQMIPLRTPSNISFNHHAACAVNYNFLNLLSPALAHSKDLYHPDENVNKVQLQTDGFIDWILLNQPPFR